MCIYSAMARPSDDRTTLRKWLIEHVESQHLASTAAKLFAISRQTATREINNLVAEGVVTASGKTQGRKYSLSLLAWVNKEIPVTPDLKEDVVWRQELAPHFADARPNVRDACQYGFTEMFNNVVAHSGASSVQVRLMRNAKVIRLWVTDNGVGVFKRIQQKLGLDDEHHAILELCKGKLTTDPAHHSGEGVFFTSRMFDRFEMISGRLAFISIPQTQPQSGDWLIDVDTKEHPEIQGTLVFLEIDPESPRVMQAVFDQFAAPNNNYGFTKTCIPVHLAKYGSEQLMSRSQAKRLLAHFDRFVQVILDFQGIELIGQAFADEIFRVYKNEHPAVNIIPIRASEQVRAMISRALGAKDAGPFLPGMEPSEEEKRKQTDRENNGSDDPS